MQSLKSASHDGTGISVYPVGKKNLKLISQQRNTEGVRILSMTPRILHNNQLNRHMSICNRRLRQRIRCLLRPLPDHFLHIMEPLGGENPIVEFRVFMVIGKSVMIIIGSIWIRFKGG